MYDGGMRTTLDIPDEQRARLLELAARRGEKGFSRIVQEALEAYLAGADALENARRRALALRGSISEDDAEAMSATSRALRDSWR